MMMLMIALWCGDRPRFNMRASGITAIVQCPPSAAAQARTQTHQNTPIIPIHQYTAPSLVSTHYAAVACYPAS